MAIIRLFTALLAAFASLVSSESSAGNISFQLSLTGSILTITERGDSSAFYPSVLRLLPDGRWEPLAAATKTALPAELAPGAHVDFVYPETSQPQTSFARFQPAMVRFYDSAGIGFGQISFLHQPPPASETLQANYSGGKLVITPPANASGSIRASWLLWPQRDGISQIRGPQKFEVRQPAALHFDWRPGMESTRIDTGVGQPAAMLLHETASGYFLQTIPGDLRVNEQRAAWLNENRLFYRLAIFLAIAAVLTALPYSFFRIKFMRFKKDE